MLHIILHIGRHKTGTTSIQHFLGENDELLFKKSGILYPKYGRDTWNQYHHPVFEKIIVKKSGEDSKALVSAMIEEASQAGASKILLSSELLSRPAISEDDLAAIRELFEGCKITIIVYLRRQDKFIQSTYAERVKKGMLAWPKTIYDINASLDYYLFLKKYSKIFGDDNIVVRNFDAAIKSGIYQDFLGVLGINDISDYKLPKKNANERWPWFYVELIRYANSTKLTRRIFSHRLIYSLIKRLYKIWPIILDSPKPLSEEEQKQFLEKYTESNNMVAREFMKKDNFNG